MRDTSQKKPTKLRKSHRQWSNIIAFHCNIVSQNPCFNIYAKKILKILRESEDTLLYDIMSIVVLIFFNCLDDILKQFTIVGSLKEQQAQQHKDFPQGNHKGELNQDRIKP